MSGVILESEGPFNRRKKTCTLYPVIYGSEVLVCGLKVSHASPGFSPQREETEIRNWPQRVFLLRRQEQRRKVRNRMEEILTITLICHASCERGNICGHEPAPPSSTSIALRRFPIWQTRYCAEVSLGIKPHGNFCSDRNLHELSNNLLPVHIVFQV